MNVYHFFQCGNISRLFSFIWSQVLWRVVKKSEATSLAAIHATLLAILVTVLSAYFLYVFTKVQELDKRALLEAEKINDVRPVQSRFGRVTQEETFDREKLVKELGDIMLGIDHDLIPKNPDGRAEKALGIMAVITQQYPFPVKIFKTKEGRFAVRGEPEPILFGDLEAVRNWVNTMEKVGSLMGTWRLNIRCLPILLEEFSKSDRVKKINEKLQESVLFRLKNEDGSSYFSSEFFEPINTYHAFFNRLHSAMTIMKSTKYYIQQADVFRTRYPSKAILLSGFLMVALSFIFGVIAPFLCQSVRSVFVFMPFLFYGLVYTYFIIQTISALY
ncbi:MAG: hypothetical protein ABSE95_11775 [Thermodesulfobacteriota bacterium]|jgi:hypothetical protein